MWRLWTLVALSSLSGLAQRVEFPKPNYCFGFLHAVPNRPVLPSEEAMRIQRDHMAHLGALASKRWLVGAGPILTPGSVRGILISRCQSVEEADKLASADPAVKAGRLFAENRLWSGPEGIGDRYWKEKAENPQAKDRMLKHAVVLLRQSANWSGWPGKEVVSAHLARVEHLKSTGKLLAFGPFTEGGDWLSLFLFDGVGVEEARQLGEQDPMVAGGHARVETYEWMATEGTFPKPPAEAK